MARAQSLEKEIDKALKEIEVKKEVINCLKEKMVEVALVLYSLMNDLANNLFLSDLPLVVGDSTCSSTKPKSLESS